MYVCMYVCMYTHIFISIQYKHSFFILLQSELGMWFSLVAVV